MPKLRRAGKKPGAGRPQQFLLFSLPTLGLYLKPRAARIPAMTGDNMVCTILSSEPPKLKHHLVFLLAAIFFLVSAGQLARAGSQREIHGQSDDWCQRAADLRGNSAGGV